MYEKRLKLISLDRIDFNNDYSPKNCRWVTKSENSKKIYIDNPERKKINSEKHMEWLRNNKNNYQYKK